MAQGGEIKHGEALLSQDAVLRGGSLEGAPAWIVEWLGDEPLCGVCCTEPVTHYRVELVGVIGYCPACWSLVGIEGEP